MFSVLAYLSFLIIFDMQPTVQEICGKHICPKMTQSDQKATFRVKRSAKGCTVQDGKGLQQTLVG